MDGVFTLAYFAGSESSHTVAAVHQLLMDDLAESAQGLAFDGRLLRAKITLCSDGKWLSNSLGLTGGNSKMGFPWCYTLTVEDEYVQSLQRDLTSGIDCHYHCHAGCRGEALNCKRPCKGLRDCRGIHGVN